MDRGASGSLARGAWWTLASGLPIVSFSLFEAGDDGKAELGGPRAVDHAMVEGDGDGAHWADGEVPVADRGPLRNAADAQDRDLGVVDDRRRQQPTELAGARDREGGTAQLLGLQLPRAGGVGEAVDLRRELIDGRPVAAADDRHDEALVG